MSERTDELLAALARLTEPGDEVLRAKVRGWLEAELEPKSGLKLGGVANDWEEPAV